MERAGLRYQAHDSNESFRVPFESTAVYIDFFAIRDQTAVHVHAPVLTDVKADAPLARLAVINAEVDFGKFAFYEDGRTVEVEYDLVGWTLDQDELVEVIGVVGRLADHWDDRLITDFGGRLHVPPDDPAKASTEAVDV